MSSWSRFKEDSKFLREFVRKYRLWVGAGLFALFIVDVIETLPPILLKDAVDTLVAGGPLEELRKIALIYLGIMCVQAVGRYAWRAFLIRSSMWAGRDLREKFAEYLFFLSTSFYDRRRVGDLMSLATNDIEAVRMALGGGLVIMADAIFYFLTIPVAMLILSPKLTFFAFLPLPLIPFIVLRQEKRIHARFNKVQAAFSSLSAMAQENLVGVRIVKAFANENVQLDRFRKVGEKYMRRNLHLAKVQSMFGPDLDFLMSTGLVLLLYFGGESVMAGAVTLGTFVAFQKYIQKMIWPMEAVGLSIAFYQRAAASSRRLDEVFTEVPEVKEPAPSKVPESVARDGRARGEIEIRGLTFDFPGTSKTVLHDVRLTVKPGERVALVGPIGSGKSTLVSLLPRLYSVPKGTIFLDGVDVNDWPLETLRRQIGFVSQDVFLFSETVRENVAFGLPTEMPQEEKIRRIDECTRLCCIRDEILQLPQGWDTRLGERGVNVSGGQKQRISLARALVGEPPVLILDDALAAVDMKTEVEILGHLKNRPNRATELMVAHRISTIRHADRIVVFDQGRIVQTGTHDALLRESGIYRTFYDQQRLIEEIEQYASDTGPAQELRK